MCGIAALYAYRAAAVDREELRRIRDYMWARGPDAAGEWFGADGRSALGHRRLSIIDLSERGAQPMRSLEGNLTVSFNGEIYNYRALRRELEADGAVFRSDSDTEVLLHLYARKGVEMLHDLRGMFAFALWDEERRAMLLARDPYGIKPVYYSDDGTVLRAASQAKALLAGGAVSSGISPAGRIGFLLFGSVPEPHTFYQHIQALPAGAYLWVTEQGPSAPQRYFSVAETFRQAATRPSALNTVDLQEKVRAELLDSVRAHLVADVPVGAFLSAGVDSSALVGLMRDAGQQDIQTLTLGFSEFQGRHEDETPLAGEISAYYQTRHEARFISREEFIRDLPVLLTAMDQPSLDGINTWLVSKAVHELGLKVAVSGLGGDELFGGYPSFSDIPRWTGKLAAAARIPVLGRVLRTLCAPVLPYTAYSPKLAGMLEYGGGYAGAYLLRRGLFMPWELPALLGREEAAEGLRGLAPLPHIEDSGGPSIPHAYAAVAALEASLYMRNQLLRDSDWAGMAHSLEIRVPLVDSVLLQNLAAALSGQSKLDGKQLLGLSPSRPLPDKLLQRPKSGFTVPTGQWLQELPEYDAWRGVSLLRRKHCHWSRRWAYTVLQSFS